MGDDIDGRHLGAQAIHLIPDCLVPPPRAHCPQARRERRLQRFIQEAQDAYECTGTGSWSGITENAPTHPGITVSSHAPFPHGCYIRCARHSVWKAPSTHSTCGDWRVYLHTWAIRRRFLRTAAREWSLISGDLFDYGLINLRAFIALFALFCGTATARSSCSFGCRLYAAPAPSIS